ncbi:GNAT family N-acetyltransferase [Streptomyces paludis]|uniref:GNAT family N-acetyltransferase n=1 Tax=Streptomyces paludis TaxID=2282738 RepID=A0A345HL90_9ACTN|nr:GNAT family N-acetyltransferase [Streptomyces paludis]AXG77464.1 GNAT family N-acetyltransferase [Streptomyces paludis]
MDVPRIRPAARSDDEALNLVDRAVWSTLHAVTPRPEVPYGPFFDARHPPEQFLVAEAVDGGGEEALAGYIRIGRPSPLVSNAHVRQIQGLAVQEWARGRGVGRALLRAGALHARNQGARRLTLRVLGHNTAARRLYASEGFVVEGVAREEFLLDGVYVDDVSMALPLT